MRTPARDDDMAAGMAGRAMAVLTMAMFPGVAVMPWFAGVVASRAAAHGFDPFAAALTAIAALLALGAAAFAILPSPPRFTIDTP